MKVQIQKLPLEHAQVALLDHVTIASGICWGTLMFQLRVIFYSNIIAVNPIKPA